MDTQLRGKLSAKALIFTNRFLTKYKKEQLVINLMHGSPLRKVEGYVENDTCDYVITELNILLVRNRMSDQLEIGVPEHGNHP